MSERNENLDLQNIMFMLASNFLHVVNLATWGFQLHFPFEGSCGFLSQLKIHRGLNPRTLEPMASTPTVTPPRRLLLFMVVNCSRLTHIEQYKHWNITCSTTAMQVPRGGGELLLILYLGSRWG
jgi:hypothetical protein